MELSETTRILVNQATLTLRTSSPFFSAVLLFAHISEQVTIPTAATDGQDIFVNAAYFAGLTNRQRAGLLLHEVLHASLLHVFRRGVRDSLLWNIAADVVVNGIVAREEALRLPPNGVREKSLEHLSVEEVYQQLLQNPRYATLVQQFSDTYIDLVDGGLSGSIAEERREHLESHWRLALKQAEVIARSDEHGNMPLGMERELGKISEAKIDWRAYLWRFMVQTPSDFQGFDRRSISQGYYLEALEGDTISVAIAIDTSGSIQNREMMAFLGEVQGILRSYPHIQCILYYADADIYGPYQITADGPIPPAVGGGGTDFCPFFRALEAIDLHNQPRACIYITDGYGNFPPVPPPFPTLWVITDDGIELAKVPFGESIRLELDDATY